MNGHRLTGVGDAQKNEVAALINQHLKSVGDHIGIFSSPAHRTQVFAEEIRKQLGVEDYVDIDEGLLSADTTINHLESCDLPIMIVITHKEVFPGVISWVGEKLNIDVFDEHLVRPRFASGWIVTKKKIQPIEPIVYR